MAKQVPVFISERKLFASELTATWQAIALDTLLGIDGSTNQPKSLFNIGDLTEITGGSMVNNMVARNTGQLNVYDAAGLAVGSTTWEALLSAGVTAYPPNFINGFIPEHQSGGQTLLLNGGSCRDSSNSTNLDPSSLGLKDLMSTWDEGFGSSVGAMVGGYAHYAWAEEVAMTGAALPSGEMAFATSLVSGYNPYEAFNQLISRGAVTNWMTNATISDVTPVYIGRKNNIGVVKSVMLQVPAMYWTPAIGPVDFEIVGTNDTITDQSSFDSATWTTLLTVEGEEWVSGLQKKFYQMTDNDTDWGWIGIKITQGSGGSYTGFENITFSSNTAINALLPNITDSTYSNFDTPINYYVFVLYNPIADTYDWCVDTHPEGGNILSNSAIAAAGYTKFRRVWAFTTSNETKIIPFKAYELSGGALEIVHMFDGTETRSRQVMHHEQSVSTAGYGNRVYYPFVPFGIPIQFNGTGAGQNGNTTGSAVWVGPDYGSIDGNDNFTGSLVNSSAYTRTGNSAFLFRTKESSHSFGCTLSSGDAYFRYNHAYTDYRAA